MGRYLRTFEPGGNEARIAIQGGKRFIGQEWATSIAQQLSRRFLKHAAVAPIELVVPRHHGRYQLSVVIVLDRQRRKSIDQEYPTV